MDYLAECICFSLMVIDTAHILDELSNLIMCTMTIGFPQCNYINWSTQGSDLDQMIGIQNVAFDDANKTWLQTSSNNTIPFVMQVILWLKYPYLSQVFSQVNTHEIPRTKLFLILRGCIKDVEINIIKST